MKARFVRLENYQLELHDIGTILRLRAGLHGGGGVVVAIEGIAEVSHLRNKLGFFLLLLLLLGVLSSLRYVDQTVYGIGRIVKEENETRGGGGGDQNLERVSFDVFIYGENGWGRVYG